MVKMIMLLPGRKLRMSKKGLLFVISGPSGTGKGTVINEMLKINNNIKLSISATTRMPRCGEVNGVNYYFLQKQDFEDLINQNGIIEYTTYCNNYYGTPKKAVENWLEKGNDVILEIEVDGKQKVEKSMKDMVSIFVMPPSFEVLKHRLEKRDTESKEVIEQRLQTAVNEMKQANTYDYIVINDGLEECVQDVLSIIKTEKMKSELMTDFVEGVLSNV